MKTLGLDLGGTKIAAAVVEDGRILERHTVSTPQTGFARVLDALVDAATTLLASHPDVGCVGVGSPGPIDFDSGTILFAPNIAGMTDAPIVRGLEERLGMSVTLENDANAAGYAEHRYGAARDLETSIFVTISTGVGGGVFIGDRVLHGANGLAGEIGHMTLQADGPLCGCGHHGCWESLASGRAMARDASYVFSRPLRTEELFDLAQSGDWKAIKIVENAARYTGIGLANLQKAFDPDGFVLGGGLTGAGAFYLDRVREALETQMRGFPAATVAVAELGTDAGVIGAAAVASSRLESVEPNP